MSFMNLFLYSFCVGHSMGVRVLGQLDALEIIVWKIKD